MPSNKLPFGLTSWSGNCWTRFLLVLAFALAFGAVWYLGPHELSVSDELLDGVAKTEHIYSKLGYIDRVEFFDANAKKVYEIEFLQHKPPLFRYRSYREYSPDLVLRYKDPSKSHWSTCVLSLLNDTAIVVEDLDQDGKIDKCYAEKRNLGM